MQQTDQQEKQQRVYGRPFGRGRSGNPFGRTSNATQRAEVEAKARELAVEFGGFESLSIAKRELLMQAAMLLLRRPKTSEDVVRHANAVTKILRAIGLKPGKPEPVKPKLADYVRDKYGTPSP